jgi:hypothetical protein
MEKRSINKVIIQVIAWVLLIQVINISIDPVDPVSDKLGRFSSGEDLSINDIESIYELISEICLGIDVPENDEDDENGSVKVINFYFSHWSIEIKNQNQAYRTTFFSIEKDFNSIVLDHTSPPPKLA